MNATETEAAQNAKECPLCENNTALEAMGVVCRMLRESGLDRFVADFLNDAFYGDYTHLIVLCRKYGGLAESGGRNRMERKNSWLGDRLEHLVRLLGLKQKAPTEYYFAYGSNMNIQRARLRIPGAVTVGRATLRGYALHERLYADIGRYAGKDVEGVLYRVCESHLRELDRFEGAPRIYERRLVTVHCGAAPVRCWTYVMTKETREMREGISFPPWYRSMCSSGARQHGVRDDFRKETK